jgi:hypothetical protein
MSRAISRTPSSTAYLHAVDVCVNLRDPTAGETSASALRCLAAGRPTIVSNVDANQELPDESLLKVPVGDEEEPMLTQALRILAAHPEVRAQLGGAGRAYVAREHTLERAARGCITFLEELQESAWKLWRPPAVPVEANPKIRGTKMQEIVDHLRSLRIDDRHTSVLRDVAAAITDLKLGKHDGVI